MIYKEKPNVLCVTYGPAESSNAEAVYLVNVTPSQVLAALTKLKDESPAIAPAPAKTRKPRRTKAEMAKEKESAEDAKEDAANTGPQKETAWP